jgi:hypothetical protein
VEKVEKVKKKKEEIMEKSKKKQWKIMEICKKMWKFVGNVENVKKM